MVKFFVYSLTLCVLYFVLEYLNGRDSTIKTGGQNDTQYIVCAPAVLRNVYLIMFLLGIIMFVVFFIFKLKGNPTVTTGHLIFSLVTASIGLMVMVMAIHWKIIINGDEMVIHKLFQSNIVTTVSELDKAKIGEKDKIILYQDGKVIATIDSLSDNYDRLVRTLELQNKL